MILLIVPLMSPQHQIEHEPEQNKADRQIRGQHPGHATELSAYFGPQRGQVLLNPRQAVVIVRQRLGGLAGFLLPHTVPLAISRSTSGKS
jgi:hypothetical protein